MKENFKFKETLYTKEDCILLNNFEDVTDKILVLNPNKLNKEYRTPENQLWIANSGFGTKNYTTGTAIYSTAIVDDEQARWERYDFLGVLKDN